MSKRIAILVFGLIVAVTCQPMQAAIRLDLVPAASTLASNDDGSTGSVSMGFTANFFGTSYTNLFVNNNGNVTFTGPLSTFTPFGLTTSSIPIIAPFFADVDTGGTINDVTYGTATVDGRNAFVANWFNVGYYSQNSDKLNSFQLVLIDRSDVGAGDFDIEFNYDKVQWETGEASGGVNGLGGSSARVGYTNGGTADFELAGSGVNGAFLDGGPAGTALIHNSFNSDIDGRYIFQARNGIVVNPSVPEPSSMLVLAGLVTCIGGSSLWRRQRAR
jgi:hypothetical protein